MSISDSFDYCPKSSDAIIFDINEMSDHGEYVVFTISDLQKTSRPGHDLQKVKNKF